MKKLFSEKFLFAILFFALGVGSVSAVRWVRDRIITHHAIADQEQTFLNDVSTFLNDDSDISVLSSTLKDSNQNIDFTQHEDQHYIYYEFKLDGITPDSLDVKVQDGVVALSGQIEKKEDKENSHMIYQSHFSRSYPAPLNADANKVQIENQKDKLILKFPKV